MTLKLKAPQVPYEAKLLLALRSAERLGSLGPVHMGWAIRTAAEQHAVDTLALMELALVKSLACQRARDELAGMAQGDEA